MDGLVHDKKVLPEIEEPYEAWGVLTWTTEVVEIWRNAFQKTYSIQTFDQAINLALANSIVETFMLSAYYAMATFDDYRKFLGYRNG